MWLLIAAGLISGGPSGQDAHQRYLRGAELYAAEDYAGAEALIAPLCHENSDARSLAFYALGNIRVRQALTASPVDADALLLEAITYYRQALDRAAGSQLNLDDARHNLELAKRLRPERGSEGKEQRAGESPSGDAAISDREATGQPHPDRDAEGSPIEVGETKTNDAARVRRSQGGLTAVDPGPLTPAEALERLAAAVERIEREQRAKLKLRTTDPRRGKGDY